MYNDKTAGSKKKGECCFNKVYLMLTLVNVYVDLVVFTRIAGTSRVLTRILKIGVKMLSAENNWSFPILFY